MLLLLTVPGPARAAIKHPSETPDVLDMSLEDLLLIEIDSVYGASGFKQKVSEAPASVTIVTSDEIQAHGYRTLADILRNVRGCYVSYDRNYSYLGVRGYGPVGDYNSRFALMVDGHRLNDNVFGGGMIGTEFPIDVDLIERVEVIRGPNSSQYVASAFLGVINVITKRGSDMEHLSVAGGSAGYGTHHGRLSYGNRFDNGLELLLSASSYGSHGDDRLYFPEFDDPASNNGVAVGADGERLQQLFTHASWGHFTAHGSLDHRLKAIPTAPFGSAFNAAGTQTVDVRGYFDLQYRQELGHGWLLSNRAYYDQFANEGTYVYDYSAFGGPSRVLNMNYSHGKWLGDELGVSKQLSERHRVSIGSEFVDNFQQDQGNYDVEPFVEYLRDRRTSTMFSLYAQDEIRVFENLVLNLGLRHDHFSTFGGTTNPRAALIYDPWAKTTFKFLYGQSFRAPTQFELFFAAPGNEINPSLRPEAVRTMEVVFEQSLPRRFSVTASAFYYPIRGLIGQELNPATGNLFYANSGSLDMRGVDVGMRRSSPGGLEGKINYSFQELANVDAGVSVTNSPRHLVQAALVVPVLSRTLFASADAQYMSRRATLAGAYSAAYAVANVTLFSRDMLKGWEFSASIHDVFDTKFSDPRTNGGSEDMLIQDGRALRVRAGYHF